MYDGGALIPCRRVGRRHAPERESAGGRAAQHCAKQEWGVSEPRFGVELHEYLDAPTVLAEAQQAEALGYASVWLADSQLIWRELYVLLGAVAATTTHVTLGTGVTNP